MSSDDLAGRRILILEDEFLIAMDVEELCRERGAEHVVIYSNLADIGSADDIVSNFDVAIIDLILGGSSTLDLARQLLERNMPFVFASGYASSEDIRDKFPGIALIGKPYAGSELTDAVVAACRGHFPSGCIGAGNLC